jgi:hypothetical protein
MKILNTLLVAVLFIGTTAFVGVNGKGDDEAQFYVKYDVTFESDEPGMEQAMPMLAGSMMEVMKNKKYNKTIFKTGTISTMTTILDNKTKKGISITEGMMGNFYTKMDEGDDKEAEPKVNIEKTEETTKILGHVCVKYIVTSDDADGAEIELWATDEIKGSYESKFIPTSGKFEGFPLKMVIETEQMTISFTATDYKDKVPANTSFDMKPPKDYEEKSADDLKGMGGM